MSESILIVDDEPAISRTLIPVLRTQGYVVETAATAAEALRRARQTAFDVALLDLGLPDADGREIIGRLHDLSCRSVLVISARHHEAEKIAALDGGADDYLSKPFSVDELMARIRAALRRTQSHHQPTTTFTTHTVAIDYAARQVKVRGKEVRLSPKEYALLDCLSRHAGQVVTRRQLLLAGWNDPTTDSQNLRTYMTLLRQKIELDPAEPRIIVTEAGVGYRMPMDG